MVKLRKRRICFKQISVKFKGEKMSKISNEVPQKFNILLLITWNLFNDFFNQNVSNNLIGTKEEKIRNLRT